MQRKPQRFSRLCAFILAVIMIVGMVPTTVFAMDGPLSGETGNGWGGVGGGSSSGAGNDLALGGSNIEDADNDKVMDSGNHNDEILDADKLPPIDDAALKLKEKVELFNRQIEAYSEWAQSFSRRRATSRVSILATLPLGGNTEWKSGLAANPYMVGRPIPVVQINGNYAFCVEWDTPNPNGNYEDGSPYTAAPVMQVLANFKQYTAANPGNINEAYLAAQFAIWQYVTTTSVNLNNFLMWSSNIPSGVRNAIFNGGADTTGISATNWKNPTGEPQTQALITFDDKFSDPYALKIIKKNEDGSKTLPGAKFSVTGPNGFSATGTTNTKGELLVGVKETGTYTVTETTPPPGYLPADPASQAVEVTAANDPTNPAEITFNNKLDGNPPPPTPGEGGDAFGQVTVIKKDNNDRPLKNALFDISIRFSNGTTSNVSSWQVVNGSNTYTYQHPVGDVGRAKVTVTEVKAPDGYILDPSPQTISIMPTYTEFIYGEDKDGNPIIVDTILHKGDYGTSIELTFKNEPFPCSLTIYKYQKGNAGIALSGAEFEIKTADGGSHWSTSVVTGADGRIKVNLPRAGTYEVIETKAPEGYVINVDAFGNNKLTIEVAKGEDKVIDVPNDKKGGVIVLKKDNQDGRLLSGATFEIRNIISGDFKTATTGNDGSVHFTDLTPGAWRITETSPPQYYMPSGITRDVEILDGSNQIITVEFRNEPYTGIRIVKLDAKTSSRLSGAVFGLYKGADLNPDGMPSGQLVSEYISNENGEVLIQRLEPGAYAIVEHQPPDGYALDDNRVRIIYVKPDDPNREIQIVFRNNPLPGIKIIKKDKETGILLPGAVFTLRHKDGAVYSDVTTGPDGTVTHTKLPLGWYTITEVRQPSGYLMPTEKIPDVELVAGKTTEVIVYNQAKPSITIVKKDKRTGDILPGATFRISWNNGANFRDVTTKEDGKAVISDLSDGWYTIVETKAPEGYLLDPTPHQVLLEGGTTKSIELFNETKPVVTLIKKDKVTGKLLPGATFRISWNNGVDFRDVTTMEDGKAVIPDLSDGWYTIVETKAPEGYLLDTTPHQVLIEGGTTKTIELFNEAKPSLSILKVDNVTKTPLANAKFKIEQKTETGNKLIGEYVSDKDGLIVLENILPGRYLLTEILAPDGYNIDTATREVTIEYGQTYKVEFQNTPKSPLYIQKVDEKGNPLAGAEFKITTMNGAMIGVVTSGHTGYAIFPYAEPGWYIVEEIKAPDGYILSNTPVNVELKTGRPAQVEFINYAKPGLTIQKLDAVTREPLAGATFKLANAKGEYIGDYTTDVNGIAKITDLTAGAYVVTELRAPDGYVLDSTPHTVNLAPGKSASVEIFNSAKPGLTIQKLDAGSRKPLVGAKFKLAKTTGEHIGDYTTDINGLIHITDLVPGAYLVTELRAPDGYVLDMTPHTINLEGGKNVSIEIFNSSKPGLQLIKKDAVTGLPVGGARFNVAFLENGGKKDLGAFTTSENGTFFIPNLTPGYYIITEIKAADGYILNPTPKEVYVESGKLNSVEVFNTPYSDLRLLKIDSETRKPLEGAIFKLFDDKRLEIGTYTSSALGEIYVSGLPSGIYFLQEQKAPVGYVLDNTVRQVDLIGGKTTTVEWKNTALGSLRIVKIDEDTKKPLYGATFLLYDNKNNVLGEFTTNQSGLITFGGSLQTGTYKIKETKAPEGYVLDETIYTITVKAGETTEFVVKNRLKVGQIQIIKVSDSKNSITGHKAGAGLKGAIFEIFDEDLDLVDKIETDRDGFATSIDLPLGKYVIKEVKAPAYYFTKGKPMYAEIKVHGDLIRFKVQNTPEKLEVSVEKRGVVETMSGETIRYTFSDIANKSNCSLDEFFWRDELPTDAVRIQSLNTGTWNERGTYDVLIKTNQKGWRRIKSNLHNNVEYTIDMRPSALGLASNEYVTNYKLEFGTVDEGFTSVKDPFITVQVVNGLPAGYRFVNNTDVGGLSRSEWVYARDSWITLIYKANRTYRKLPRTGGLTFES